MQNLTLSGNVFDYINLFKQRIMKKSFFFSGDNDANWKSTTIALPLYFHRLFGLLSFVGRKWCKSAESRGPNERERERSRVSYFLDLHHMQWMLCKYANEMHSNKHNITLMKQKWRRETRDELRTTPNDWCTTLVWVRPQSKKIFTSTK